MFSTVVKYCVYISVVKFIIQLRWLVIVMLAGIDSFTDVLMVFECDITQSTELPAHSDTSQQT